MVTRFAFIFFAVFLLVSGCTQKPLNTTVHIQKKFVFKSHSNGKFTSKWWKSFHNAELNRIIDTAIKNNRDLQMALLSIKEAKLNYKISQANLLPQISSSFGYSRTRSKRDSFKSTSTSYNLDIYTNYELDVWGSIRNGISISNLEKNKAEYYYNSIMITMVSNLVRYWLECVAINNKLEILDNRLNLAKKNASLQKTCFKNGACRLSDYLSTEDEIKKIIVEIETLKNRYNSDINHIKTLSGMKNSASLYVKTKKLPNINNVLDIGYPASVLANRPDVRSSLIDLKEAFLGVKIAKSQRLPNISLSSQLNYSTTKASIRDIFTNWFYSLAAKIAYTILDFNKAKLNQKIKEIEKNKSLIKYKDTVFKAIEEVENAYIQLSTDKQTISKIKKSIDIQSKNLSIAKESFLSGSSSLGSYIVEKDQILSLKSQLIDAQNTFLNDLVNLYKAAGGCYYNEK